MPKAGSYYRHAEAAYIALDFSLHKEDKAWLVFTANALSIIFDMYHPVKWWLTSSLPHLSRTSVFWFLFAL